MKKYDPDATCVKCGGGGIGTEHVEEYIPGEQVRYIAASLGVPKPERQPEHIARECRNCGHTWNEAPLDAESDDPGGIKATCEAAKVRQDENTQRVCDAFREEKPMSSPFQEFLDKAIESQKEQAKAFIPIRVGDVFTVGEGDICEHEVLAHPTSNWYCLDGYARLINKYELATKFTLIRRGPKVHTLKGVDIVPSRNLNCDDGVYSTEFTCYSEDADAMYELLHMHKRVTLTFKEDTK